MHLALLGALAIFCALGAASASAATYVPGVPPTFCSGAGAAPGQCEELKGVAVDQSNGHVYVVDTNSPAPGNFRISEYTSAGVFVKGFGVGVADGTAVPQVCTATCVPGAATGAGAVGTGARGIAVDPVTHIVYFVAGTAKIAYYDGTTGAFLGEFTGTASTVPPAPQTFSAASGLALDTSNPSQHYIYVATGNGTNPYVIDKFKVPVVTGGIVTTVPAYVCQITGTEASSSASECHGTPSKDGLFNGLLFPTSFGIKGASLAVDASGNVYVAEDGSRSTVSMFDSTGAWVKAFTATTPVAVAAGASGSIFVTGGGTADGGSKIQEFQVSTASVISEITLAGTTSLGVAVDSSGLSSNGSVYAAEKGGKQLYKYRIQPRKLTVTKAGSGASGSTVTSAPPGISCGVDCDEEYTEGTVVTLTATPDANSTFSGWSGAGCSGTGTCVVTMNAAQDVTATFVLVKRTLTVTKTGTGTGTVTSAPPGINCGATCAAEFDHGTSVTLTGTPAGDSKAVVWTGCDSIVGANQCKVEMTGAKAVTAKFDLAPTYTLAVSKGGTGTGSVTCNGAACLPTYLEGTKVTLAAAPDSSSTFSGWSGAGCSGTGTCVVTMSANTAVTASFTANPPHVTPVINCVVPKLAGKTLAQAKSALTAANCTLGKVTKPKPKKGKKLVVKSSNPKAGTVLAQGSKVDLKLAPKPKKGKKPKKNNRPTVEVAG